MRAAVAVAVVTALTLSACSTRNSESSSPKAEIDGGTIIWSKPAEAVALDPTTSLIGSSWELLNIVYDQLVTIDEQQQVQPSLAESWENPSLTSTSFICAATSSSPTAANSAQTTS